MSTLQCARCALPHSARQPCPDAFQTQDLPWVSVHASLSYRSVASALVQRLKFNGELGLIHALGDWMADLPPPWLGSVKNLTIIPLPSTRKSLQSRGFNQSAELAKCIKKRLHLRGQVRHVLNRHESTQQQSTLGKEDRWMNMSNAFTVNPSQGKPTTSGGLIIDDVMTTGATVMNAALTLKQSGHWPIYVWVLARTHIYNPEDSIDEHRVGSP